MPLKTCLVIITFFLSTLACSFHTGNHLNPISATRSAPSPVSSAVQQPANAADTTSIANTVDRLHRTTADWNDVPAEVSTLLTQFKRQLRDQISLTMNEVGSSSSPDDFRIRIWDRLTAAGVTICQSRNHTIEDGDCESKWQYGDLFDVQINRPLHHPELIAVVVTLEIPCGRDSSLYIFRKQARAWQLVLAHEANGYQEISGAQGYFDYRIAFDSADKFFLVIVNVTPWCTSAWQMLRFSAVRPAPDADKPTDIVSGKETIYLGIDPPTYQLVVRQKWFSIRFVGEATEAQIANGFITRNRLIRFRIDGNRAVSTTH